MEQNTLVLLFALLRTGICGGELTAQERSLYTPERFRDMMKIAQRHDITPILACALKKSGLAKQEEGEIDKCILKAVYRYERMRYAYEEICNVLEEAQIPFLPLKGSVIRDYYPEPWMRTSCDIDILVHLEDWEKARTYLQQQRNYVEIFRSTHDVSLETPNGIHVELHYDLMEEGVANNVGELLRTVWGYATPRENSGYWYEMTDAYFYFYHIAHMAKHFEVGGCGIRPFLDLWILDHKKDADIPARNALLEQGKLLPFADGTRRLSEVWLAGGEQDALTRQMENYLLRGGTYGSAENRVVLQQKKQGGRLGYLLSRIFAPYAILKRYYPILEKYPWLMPAMQVRRWLMLLRPDVARRTRRELLTNSTLDKGRAEDMHALLVELGLD